MIKDKKVLRKLDVAFGAALLVGSIILLCWSASMPVSGLGGGMQSSFWLAPGALPVFVSSVLVALSLTLIAGAWKEGGRVSMEDVRKALSVARTREAKYVFIMVGLLVAYIFLMLGNLPYLVSTSVFLMAFMFIFKAGKPHIILITALLTAVAIWYCFGKIVLIPLP